MMKNKKALIIICIIVVILLVFTGFLIYRNTTPIGQFNKKISMLEKMYEKNTENEKSISDRTVIISISNGKDKAIVKNSTDKTLKTAFNKAKEQINDIIKENNYKTKWVKLDVIDSRDDMSKRDFRMDLMGYEKDYTYRKGLILNYDNRNIVLTEAELNANNIISYDDVDLSLEDLNKYLDDNEQDEVDDLPEKVTVFTTKGFFCDENNKCYELCNEGTDTGRRKIDPINKEDIQKIIDNSKNYLSNMVQGNGKFVYGYYPLTDKKIDNYNILRHAGATWVLIKCYNTNEKDANEKLKNIDLAMNYLIENIKQKDENTSYITEEKNGELKLGANALTIIAMSEYTKTFNNTKYVDTMKKLGNGILDMQEDDGSFVHVLSQEDYSLKDENRTVYYDGEAMLGLCRLYDITKDEKYLDSAKKAMQYFMDNNYIQYCDHWISYSINELIKYDDNKDYYEFGLKNVAENMAYIKSKNYTSHTVFEMLMQCFELYNNIKENNIDIPYMSEFPEEEFLNLLKEKLDLQINSYMFPEIAMYVENPDKYVDTIFIRQSNYQIRIDDIQHTILGFNEFVKNYEKIM